MGSAGSRFSAHLLPDPPFQPRTSVPNLVVKSNLPLSLTRRVICAQILFYIESNDSWGRVPLQTGPDRADSTTCEA